MRFNRRTFFLVAVMFALFISPSFSLDKRFFAGGGLGGGSAVIKIGYLFPIKDEVKLKFKPDIGFGIGDNYILLTVRGVFEYDINPNYYLLASIDTSSYSKKVQGIFGLSDYISKAMRAGVGFGAGKKIGALDLEAMYSLALGIVIYGSCYF